MMRKLLILIICLCAVYYAATNRATGLPPCDYVRDFHAKKFFTTDEWRYVMNNQEKAIRFKKNMMIITYRDYDGGNQVRVECATH
jgi:hypothetical protein